MRTIRLCYSQQKLPQKLKLKTLLLTFFTTLFLSACGIKGDLYQTPEQPVTEQETTELDANKAQDDSNKALEREKKPVTEQVSEEVIEPESVKSPQNVS